MPCDFFSLANPHIATLAPYQPGKSIAELQRELGLKRIIKLASNENPLGPSQEVLEAIKGFYDLARYPDGNGHQLKTKLAAYHNLKCNQITLGNGSNDILEFITRVFVSTQDQVMFSQYSFAVYPLVTQIVGAEAMVVPAENWGHNLSAMQKKITSKTRLIFIANPNNPTGTWLDKAALYDFLSHIPKDIIVILDQAYFDYAVVEPNYPKAVDWLREFRNLVICRTFSKAYGLAGLRIGYALSSPEIADLMNRVRQPFNVNAVALLAASIALENNAYLAKIVELNQRGMMQLTAGCQKMGLSFIESLGNFLCIDFKTNALPIYKKLLSSGVIVRPLENYQMPNHLRVTVGLPSENELFLTSLRDILNAKA